MGSRGSVSFDAQLDDTPLSAHAVMADTLGSLIDDVVQADFMIGLAQARRAEAIERARVWADLSARASTGSGSSASRAQLAERSFMAELAVALRIPQRTAQNLVWTCRTLVNDLPATLAAVAEGRATWRHAQILVDQSYSLEGDAVAQLETTVLPLAERLTPSQFERKTRKIRESLDPESMVERQVKAQHDRFVTITPERDGMATLTAFLPAAQAVAIEGRLTDIARGLQCDDEQRTLTQLRADVFSDLLLDCAPESSDLGAGAGAVVGAGVGDAPARRYRSIRPRVLITVPVGTLLQGDAKPGWLEGYGPIDPQTSRELTANGRYLQRLLTDPISGAILAIGRKRYRIPDDLRTWLRVRDGTCRFPSCSRSASRCDLDHTDDWAMGGGTDDWNLAHLCPAHHTLKHASAWTVEQSTDGSGSLTWTSPHGTSHITEPELAAAPMR